MTAKTPAFLDAPELTATLSDPAFAIAVIGLGMLAATETPRGAVAVYKDSDGALTRPFLSVERPGTPPVHDGTERPLLYTTDADFIRRDAVLVAHTHPGSSAHDQAPASIDIADFLWQNEAHPGITKGIITPHGVWHGLVTLTLFRARQDLGFKVNPKHLIDGLHQRPDRDGVLQTMHAAGIVSMTTTAEIADSTISHVPQKVHAFYR